MREYVLLITFCGHNDITNDYIPLKKWLEKSIVNYIEKGASTFYLGGYGQFDLLAVSILRKLKKEYPHINIILILAYLNQKYEKNLYDSTIYPELETVPKRFAILKRNEFMIENSDIIIAYVKHSWGGAAKSLEYGKRKKKQIIQFELKVLD